MSWQRYFCIGKKETVSMANSIAIIIGWVADKLCGDPLWLPHPVVYFGKAIAFGERHLNKGTGKRVKGGFLAVTLILLTFFLTWGFLHLLHPITIGKVSLATVAEAILVFYCLAGTTLIKEVKDVFKALDRSLEDGRKQVARIVGRDTSALDAQEIRKAALETLAENLSDGVIAPLFWLLLLGVPGMMTYKMVNTLDSMIGYRTERYRLFGTVAARIDDVANWLPARITALLMAVAGIFIHPTNERHRSFPQLLKFIFHYGPCHASPNSGWPEAALAGILNCRFGGPHIYFGELIDKPFIGEHDRELTSVDATMACNINIGVEVMMLLITLLGVNILYKQ